MVDIEDLKSSVLSTCGFESRPGHKYKISRIKCDLFCICAQEKVTCVTFVWDEKRAVMFF